MMANADETSETTLLETFDENNLYAICGICQVEVRLTEAKEHSKLHLFPPELACDENPEVVKPSSPPQTNSDFSKLRAQSVDSIDSGVACSPPESPHLSFIHPILPEIEKKTEIVQTEDVPPITTLMDLFKNNIPNVQPDFQTHSSDLGNVSGSQSTSDVRYHPYAQTKTMPDHNSSSQRSFSNNNQTTVSRVVNDQYHEPDTTFLSTGYAQFQRPKPRISSRRYAQPQQAKPGVSSGGYVQPIMQMCKQWDELQTNNKIIEDALNKVTTLENEILQLRNNCENGHLHNATDFQKQRLQQLKSECDHYRNVVVYYRRENQYLHKSSPTVPIYPSSILPPPQMRPANYVVRSSTVTYQTARNSSMNFSSEYSLHSHNLPQAVIIPPSDLAKEYQLRIEEVPQLQYKSTEEQTNHRENVARPNSAKSLNQNSLPTTTVHHYNIPGTPQPSFQPCWNHPICGNYRQQPPRQHLSQAVCKESSATLTKYQQIAEVSRLYNESLQRRNNESTITIPEFTQSQFINTKHASHNSQNSHNEIQKNYNYYSKNLTSIAPMEHLDTYGPRPEAVQVDITIPETKFPISCKLCSKRFMTESKFYEHQETVHNITCLKICKHCHICGKVYSRASTFAMHLRKQHNYKGDIQKYSTCHCWKCGQELNDLDTFKLHLCHAHSVSVG